MRLKMNHLKILSNQPPRLWLILAVPTIAVACSSETRQSGRGGKSDLPSNGSCSRSCGGQAQGGTCWCDDLCEHYDDCCSDVVSVCLDGDGPDLCYGAENPHPECLDCECSCEGDPVFGWLCAGAGCEACTDDPDPELCYGVEIPHPECLDCECSCEGDPVFGWLCAGAGCEACTDDPDPELCYGVEIPHPECLDCECICEGDPVFGWLCAGTGCETCNLTARANH